MVGDGSGDVDELDALHLSLVAHAPHERRVWGGAAYDEDGDAMARAAAGEGEALAQEKLCRAAAAAALGWVGSAGVPQTHLHGTSAAAAASPRASPAATGVAAWGGDEDGCIRAETRLSSRGERKAPEVEIFTATVASRVE